MFNCQEIPLSLSPWLLYRQRCGKNNRQSASITKTHYSVAVGFQFPACRRWRKLYWQAKQFFIASSFFFLSRIGQGWMGLSLWDASNSEKNLKRETTLAFEAKEPNRAAKYTWAGTVKVLNNYWIADLLPKSDFRSRSAVLYHVLLMYIFWCTKRADLNAHKVWVSKLQYVWDEFTTAHSTRWEKSHSFCLAALFSFR